MSQVVGICMVKNEEDIIEMTIRHFIAEGLDKVIVYNNLSSDSTESILWKLKEQFINVLEVRQDNHFPYDQELKMNQWIFDAHKEFKAEWIIPFDADEIWTHRDSSISLKQYLTNSPFDVISCPVYDMIPFKTTNTTTPSRDILWRQPVPEVHPVVMFRYQEGARVLQGNHYVHYHNAKTYIAPEIEVCHFQYRSFDQYKKKLRNGKQVYDATNMDHTIGQHWREGGSLSDDELWIRWVMYCDQAGIVLEPCYPKGQIWR